MPWLGLLIGCFSLLIDGCSFVPAYSRPELALPARWSTTSESEPGRGLPIRGGWWQDFASPELSKFVEKSLAENFTLQAAHARIEEARGASDMAGATLYPAIGGGVTFDKSDGVKHSRTRDIFAQASYEVDFWGKNRSLADSSALLAEATEFDADTLALSLSASVADTYFQILSLRERLALAERIAKGARDLLALVEARLSQGAASNLQVQEQRNAVAVFDGAVPVLRQQLEQNTHLLAVLIGGSANGIDIAGQTLGGIAIPQVEPGLPASLLTQRPDVRAAEARLISAHFDIGAARAALFPNISLTGEVGATNNSLGHFFPPLLLSDIGVTLVQPLFEGGKLQGQLTVDRARATELAANYRQTVSVALQDVEDSLTAGERLGELEVSAGEAVDSARQASDLATAQYRLGAADFLTVLTAERTLYQAEDSLLQVKMQRLQAAVQLVRSLGGGFVATDKVSFNGPADGQH